MNRVKNGENRPPINGWQYHQPQTGWDLAKNAPHAVWDLRLAKQALIDHRKANPRFNLPTDDKTVENQLHETNALRMLQIPGGDIYVEIDPTQSPKQMPQHQQSGLRGVVGAAKRVAQGASAIVEWIRSGAEAVPQPLANQRAEVCASCPLNDKGGIEALFTIPAQEAIRFALNQRKEWNLSTPVDARLHVCSACLCPLKLKVHMPIQAILAKIPKESMAGLTDFCWIRKEKANA